MSSLRNTSDPRDAYLDAARACILDLGWRRTTLTEVARRAGVSRMTIYRAWSDMGQLLGDLMTREWAQVAAMTHREEPGTILERIARDVVDAVCALRENELFIRIIELDPQLLLPYLLSRRGRSQDLILDRLVPAIRMGQEAGEIRDGDPMVMARALLLATHGFVLSLHTMIDDTVTDEALEEELATLVTRTLAVAS